MKFIMLELDLIVQEKKLRNQQKSGFHIIKQAIIENGMEI